MLAKNMFLVWRMHAINNYLRLKLCDVCEGTFNLKTYNSTFRHIFGANCVSIVYLRLMF